MKTNEQRIFPEAEDMGPREWGRETLLVLSPGNYSFKKLELNAGAKGGLQYHNLKDECGYLVSGELMVRFEGDDGSLRERIVEAGEFFHFPAGLVHQEEAITDCVIIEGSTPHFNDRVRVEAKFGLEADGGLPSTNVSEVITR